MKLSCTFFYRRFVAAVSVNNGQYLITPRGFTVTTLNVDVKTWRWKRNDQVSQTHNNSFSPQHRLRWIVYQNFSSAYLIRLNDFDLGSISTLEVWKFPSEIGSVEDVEELKRSEPFFIQYYHNFGFMLSLSGT